MTLEADDELRRKIDVYKDKLRHSLAARFLLRFHVSLILLFAIFLGWMVDLLLLRLGVGSMIVRYTITVLAAYAGFLFGVYCWVEYSGIRQYLSIRRREELVGDDVPRDSGIRLGGSLRDFRYIDAPFGWTSGDGCLVVIGFVVICIVGYYFFGGYLISNAATFFAEIVLELLLAAGLLRGLNKVEASGWVVGVWRSTWPSLVFSILVAWLVAGFVHSNVPNAKTIPEAWRMWKTEGPRK